jgi:hypothetical protein
MKGVQVEHAVDGHLNRIGFGEFFFRFHSLDENLGAFRHLHNRAKISLLRQPYHIIGGFPFRVTMESEKVVEKFARMGCGIRRHR